MTYAEKLKHPRWQKKRLEILERDKWTCQLCGDTETTFHIHHKKYSGNPWDADNSDLISYCEDCHTVVEMDGTGPFIIQKVIKILVNPGTMTILTLIYHSDSQEFYAGIYQKKIFEKTYILKTIIQEEEAKAMIDLFNFSKTCPHPKN